jgi:hypothetical protein
MPACQTKFEFGVQFVSVVISNQVPMAKVAETGFGFVTAR